MKMTMFWVVALCGAAGVRATNVCPKRLPLLTSPHGATTPKNIVTLYGTDHIGNGVDVRITLKQILKTGD
jgi:hypothetical protein